MKCSTAGVLPLLLLATATFAACGGDSTTPTGTPPEADPCVLASQCLTRLEVVPDRFVLHYRTWALEAGHQTATRAVVIVHGAGRNAEWNFQTGLQAVGEASDLDETVVIAPRFQIFEDLPADDEPYWSSGGWKRGHLSRPEGPAPRISSYAVLDTIVARLSDPSRFPAMAEIVVAGHSAGGQVAHRYSAGGMDPRNGVPVRYVVANPSTYLFAADERPDPDGDGFFLPDRTDCPDYDEWHYGLAGLNSYMSRLSDAEIVERLTERDVTIMVGDRDTGSSQLDVSCGANLQGEHRYARGLNLMAYMDAFFPGHGHTGVVVPFVAHASREMFTSDQGLTALFR